MSINCVWPAPGGVAMVIMYVGLKTLERCETELVMTESTTEVHKQDTSTQKYTSTLLNVFTESRDVNMSHV